MYTSFEPLYLTDADTSQFFNCHLNFYLHLHFDIQFSSVHILANAGLY